MLAIEMSVPFRGSKELRSENGIHVGDQREVVHKIAMYDRIMCPNDSSRTLPPLALSWSRRFCLAVDPTRR